MCDASIFAATDTAELRGKFMSMGLDTAVSKPAHDWLRQYLHMTKPSMFAVTVDRIGWKGNTFVLPDENIGPEKDEMILFNPAREMAHHLQKSGTLQNWQDQVSRYCSGNSRLLFCVSCAAAAPTVGKTTCLIVVGSFWGDGSQNGFFSPGSQQQMALRITPNGIITYSFASMN